MVCFKKISVREKMTDDNKKTPTDDKITELSAWQKRNKEYLEKKFKDLRDINRKLKAKKHKKTKTFQKKKQLPSQRKNLTNEKSLKRKMNLRPKRIQKQMEKVQKEKRMIRL